jgi:hypothetical protein
VDDRGEAVEAKLAGRDVQPRSRGLRGEAPALRVPGEDEAQLDLVPLRPGVQRGPAEERAGRPVEEGALAEAVFAPDRREGGDLGCRAVGVEGRSANVVGHVRVGVHLGQCPGVPTGERRHEQSLGLEVHGRTLVRSRRG